MSVFDLCDNQQLYDVLGVARAASEDEIRRAYKRLAVQYHPDKNPQGEERFKEISFAHGILSDPEQRKMYDARTLRGHLDKMAKSYDPTMDPNVELTAEQLREFVEKLRNQSKEDDDKRSAFERRREEELARQAEYNRRRPQFSMPELPTTSATVESYVAQQRTTAEMLERLQGLSAASSKKDTHDPLESLRGDASSGLKSQMLDEFRRRRQAEGISTVKEVGPKPEVLRDLDERKYNFVAEDRNKPSYSRAAQEAVQRTSNFDYRSFIVRQHVDGGVIKDAILADALGDYDPDE